MEAKVADNCRGWKGKMRLVCLGKITYESAHRAIQKLSPKSSDSASSKKSKVVLGWNFASAMIKWAAAGCPVRTKLRIEEILAICKKCPELEGRVCKKCGCQCHEKEQLLNKIALATEKCPLGKWS